MLYLVRTNVRTLLACFLLLLWGLWLGWEGRGEGGGCGRSLREEFEGGV